MSNRMFSLHRNRFFNSCYHHQISKKHFLILLFILQLYNIFNFSRNTPLLNLSWVYFKMNYCIMINKVVSKLSVSATTVHNLDMYLTECLSHTERELFCVCHHYQISNESFLVISLSLLLYVIFYFSRYIALLNYCIF